MYVLRKVKEAIGEVIEGKAALNLIPGVGQATLVYIQHLENQASGKWKRLPEEVQCAVSSDYERINLKDVRYAENIDTIHGQAITIGDSIFFPCKIDILNNANHLHWMLHELEHVSQYDAHGGITPFIVKYLVNGGIEMIKERSFSIHDNIGLEKDATNKANRIIRRAIRGVRYHSVNAGGFEERIRVISDYGSRQEGFRTAIPNFHQQVYDGKTYFGAFLIKEGAVEWRDVSASELGNPGDVGARYRAINDYAGRNGFGGAFPNFHQAKTDRGLVYGVYLIKREAMEWKDVPMNKIDTSSLEARHRTTSDVAREYGLATGFPNYHQGPGVFGTIFLRKEYVEWRDICIEDLSTLTIHESQLS